MSPPYLLESGVLVGEPPQIRPSCTYASVGLTLCQTLRAKYESSAQLLWLEDGIDSDQAGKVWTYTTYQNTSVVGFWAWPSATTLGPSCTLGCGSCAITGGTVQLLYWPATEVMTETATDSLTAYAFGTSFVYPTLYISYGSVYASDSCGEVGTMQLSTILALPNSSALSSLYVGENGIGTASFNISNLNSPVPSSVYCQQLQCNPGVPRISNPEPPHGNKKRFVSLTTDSYSCSCNGPYEPILVVPSELLKSLDPSWASCSADIRGQYDPPHALTAAARAATPTPISWMPTQLPSPGSFPLSSQPFKTSKPGDPVQTQKTSWSRADPATSSKDSPNPIGGSPSNPYSMDPRPGDGGTKLPALGSRSGDPRVPQKSAIEKTGAKSLLSPEADDPTRGVGNGIGAAIMLGLGMEAGTLPPYSEHPADPGDLGDPGESGDLANQEDPEDPSRAMIQILENSADPSVSQSPHVQVESGQNSQHSHAQEAGGTNHGSGAQPYQGIWSADSGRPVSVLFAPEMDLPGSPGSILTEVGGQAIAIDSADPGAIVIGGTRTIRPGGTTVINNTPLLVGPGGVVVGSFTIPYPSKAIGEILSTSIAKITSPPNRLKAKAVFEVGGTPYTAYELDNQPDTATIFGPNGIPITLCVHCPAKTIDGQVISLAAGDIKLGPKAIPFSSILARVEAEATFTDEKGHTHLVIEQVISNNGDSDIAVLDNSITLSVNGPIMTVDGEVLSLAKSGLIINGIMETWKIVTAADGSIISAGGLNPSAGASLTSPTAESPGLQTANVNIAIGKEVPRMWEFIVALGISTVYAAWL